MPARRSAVICVGFILGGGKDRESTCGGSSHRAVLDNNGKERFPTGNAVCGLHDLHLAKTANSNIQVISLQHMCVLKRYHLAGKNGGVVES